MKRTIKNKDLVISKINKLIDACENNRASTSNERKKALEYYNKEPSILNPGNKSKAVSGDLRKTIKKLMPSIMRSLCFNKNIVSYIPVNFGDEKYCEQVNKYINSVIIPKGNVENALYDAIFDALLLKTGILKWSAIKEQKIFIQDYTDQTEEQMFGLEQISNVKLSNIVEYTDELGNITYSFNLKRSVDEVLIRLDSIPPGSFLIHPRAETIQESPIIGEKQNITRSDLISRGYKKSIINKLNKSDGSLADDDNDYRSDKKTIQDINDYSVEKSMEEILIYNLYVKLDLDDDGIAELYNIVYAYNGNSGDTNDNSNIDHILEMNMVSEIPYAKVVIEREAHQFEGHSIAEDVISLQEIKTSLLRAGLNNINWQNNPMNFVNLDAIQNPEDLNEPSFGKPIQINTGYSPADAFTSMTFPVIADVPFKAMKFIDLEIENLTGITDTSGGLNPESFQNMTATSASLLSQKGIDQIEMIIRQLSNGGIKDAFKGLLRLVVSHADSEKVVNLDNEWVAFDPRVWNSDLDCIINVGLGAGSKERDINALQFILQNQKEIFSQMGIQNPFVTPEQYYNTLEKIVEATGLPAAEPYFTKPTKEQVMGMMEAKNSQPSDEQIKQMIEQQKAQDRKEIEILQMQADMKVETNKNEQLLMLEKLKADNKLALEQLKIQNSMNIEQIKASVQQSIANLRAQLDKYIADQTVDKDLHIHHDNLAMSETGDSNTNNNRLDNV